MACTHFAHSQSERQTYRNGQQNNIVAPFRIPLPDAPPTYKDLDGDGDPDLLYCTIGDGIPVLWIDDDDDMREGDLEGDMDNDCLLVDLNGDGNYGGEKDLNIDWSDEDGDGLADVQCIVDNGFKDETGKWASHYIWFIDNDKDGVLGYINWDAFQFEGWDHEGMANFFCDYNGKSTMLKVHITPWNLQDLEYNWENPFLFFDPDNDGLTEMAMRLVDEPVAIDPISDSDTLQAWKFSHNISLVQMTFDLDNDTRPGNELDFDMSLKFTGGEGFNYEDQVHEFSNISGLDATDHLFDDPRWRHTKSLVYPDHDEAYELTFKRGKWGECWFVFDEDDDCHRWERVEFYEPKDPFKIGTKNGGLDHNPQADASGDRGEWDMDNSGEGQLYISPLDGRLHLYGAETGYWRIDQNATYYQGWQGWRGPNLQPEDFDRNEPERFGTMKYEDIDDNGFMDRLSMDLDGDMLFEEVISLIDMGIDDRAKVMPTHKMGYQDFHELYEKMADAMWINAQDAITVAQMHGVNTVWYSHFMQARSSREKYHHGYWLSLYVYHDLTQKAILAEDTAFLEQLREAQFSSSWSLLLD
jgi:hypothetical protein